MSIAGKRNVVFAQKTIAHRARTYKYCPPLPCPPEPLWGPFRDFSQKEKGIPAKFQRKKSLKKGKNQSILTTEII